MFSRHHHVHHFLLLRHLHFHHCHRSHYVVLYLLIHRVLQHLRLLQILLLRRHLLRWLHQLDILINPFTGCASQVAYEDANRTVATAPMSRDFECQLFIFSLSVVLGQWFICIKLFYSLKFPIRRTNIYVGV